MRRMKYIIIDNGLEELPFIFSDLVNHNDMERALQRLVHGDTVSAGFVVIKHEEVGSHYMEGDPTFETHFVCYGESISLDLKSRPEDSDVLNRVLGVTNQY